MCGFFLQGNKERPVQRDEEWSLRTGTVCWMPGLWQETSPNLCSSYGEYMAPRVRKSVDLWCSRISLFG